MGAWWCFAKSCKKVEASHTTHTTVDPSYKDWFGIILGAATCVNRKWYAPTCLSINQNQSVSIGINRNQSESISTNQHQSAPICINQNQSASIGINKHKSINDNVLISLYNIACFSAGRGGASIPVIY